MTARAGRSPDVGPARGRALPDDVAQWARNLALLAGTARRHAADDPVLLAVQAARRLPGPARSALGVALVKASRPRGVTRALAEFLCDHHEASREALHAARPRTVLTRRLVAELGVQLGLPPPADAAPTVQARAAWSRGDLDGALAVVGDARGTASRRLGARLRSESELLSPGWRVRPSRPRSRPAGATAAAAAGEARAHRVLHLLTNSLPHTTSGYAQRSHRILTAQQAHGLEVEAVTRLGYPVIVGLPGARGVDVVDGVRYRRLLPASLADTPAGRLEQTVDTLLTTYADRPPTVVHTTTHFPNALVAQAVAAELGVPWVYEVRGQLEKTWLASRPAHEQPRAAASPRYLLAREKETEMALAADHVVTLSESLRADLEARGVPGDRITVVPNAVDAAMLGGSATPAEARRGLGLPETGFWVGTVSSLVGYEGLDLLVDAVHALRATGLDVRCAVVGDGVARPGLLRRVERLGLHDAVVLPGRVPPAEARRWHEALDVFCVPRRDLEVSRTVTPLKPIEAMACSRPVVASDLPALREVVGVPESGLLFTADDVAGLADTLRSLHDDPDQRRVLAGNGRRFAATRTWDAMAARYRHIYDRVGSHS